MNSIFIVVISTYFILGVIGNESFEEKNLPINLEQEVYSHLLERDNTIVEENFTGAVYRGGCNKVPVYNKYYTSKFANFSKSGDVEFWMAGYMKDIPSPILGDVYQYIATPTADVGNFVASNDDAGSSKGYGTLASWIKLSVIANTQYEIVYSYYGNEKSGNFFAGILSRDIEQNWTLIDNEFSKCKPTVYEACIYPPKNERECFPLEKLFPGVNITTPTCNITQCSHKNGTNCKIINDSGLSKDCRYNPSNKNICIKKSTTCKNYKNKCVRIYNIQMNSKSFEIHIPNSRPSYEYNMTKCKSTFKLLFP